MKKRFMILLAIILAVVALPSSSPVSALEPVRLVVDAPDAVSVGSVLEVKIRIENLQGQNFDAANYWVRYRAPVDAPPLTLTLLSIEDGTSPMGAITNTWSNNPAGACKVVSNLVGVTEGCNDSAVLAILRFEVLDKAFEAAINLEGVVVSDCYAEEITNIELVSDIVFVRTPGDVNMDGSINAMDITALARQIAGVDPVTDSSDVKQDSDLNCMDLTMLERKIAGLW